VWAFETAEDDGELVAIRQLVVEPSGAVQPVDYIDRLDAISADEFTGLWTT
jgi:hypothetical protein